MKEAGSFETSDTALHSVITQQAVILLSKTFILLLRSTGSILGLRPCGTLRSVGWCVVTNPMPH